MRLAVVVAPPPASHDADPIDVLRARLARGGFCVVYVPSTLDVPGKLTTALEAAAEGDSLLVYVVGRIRLEGPRIVLLLPPRDAYPLDTLGEVARGRRTKDALFVLDLVHDDPEDDALRAAEYVQTAVDAIGARQHGYGVLVGVGGSAGREGWPFTRLLLEAIDDPVTRNEQGVTPISRVYGRVRSAPELGARVPSFAYVRGGTDFVLLEPDDGPSAQASGPSPTGPPSRTNTFASDAPPSSSPTLESILAMAGQAAKKHAWEDALGAYKKALMVAPAADGAGRAAIYTRIGEAKRQQGKTREAELNFEKALEAHAATREAYEALVALATETGDLRRALWFRRKLRAELDDASQLYLIAELCEDKLGDTRAAVEALEEARSISPGDVAVLRKLSALYEKMRRWQKVVEVTGDLCRELNDPKERGALRFMQGDIALARLRDEGRGLPLLEAALEEDPAHDKALVALVAVRTRREEWQQLERTYARLIDRHAERGDFERAGDACTRLGFLRRDQLLDGPGAMDAFDGALRCRPGDVETRAAYADLLVTKGDVDGALHQLERMSAQAPTRVATHRKLFELHKRAGRADRAWLAATALEELRAADMDHQLQIDQFRPEPTTMMRPAAALGDDAWRELLRASGADEMVARILRTIARAAGATRVDVLRSQKKLLSLSPQRKQSATSTVSIVRTFTWASQVLSTPLPDLYVYDDVPGGLGAVQGETMATAIGPAVLTGLPVRELAFVVARHLTYYRPEHYPLIFFPTLSELSTLFLAAVSIAIPSAGSGGPGLLKLRAELEKHLMPSEREELAQTVERFDEAGGRVDLASWIRGVELTATRAGLALAGDLAVAMRVLRREERTIADVSLDDRRADLLAYTASPTYAKLREKLGVAAGTPSATA
jgi:tetratricopeptide (TPR) repeat protein